MTFQGIEYRLLRSKRKTLAIEVGRDGTVTVRAPLLLAQSEIDRFLAQKRQWIGHAVEKQQNRADRFAVSCEELERLRALAKECIPKKVAYFSRLMRLYPAAVHITTARTRFGSCSGKNSLNFSVFLMLFPEKAIDYVVVHELAHIRHHNHSKAFYALIETYLPDYRERAALLKQ